MRQVDLTPPELRRFSGYAHQGQLEVVRHDSGVHGLRDAQSGATYYISSYERIWRHAPEQQADGLRLFDPARQTFIDPQSEDLLPHERFAQLSSRPALMVSMGLSTSVSVTRRLAQGALQGVAVRLFEMLPLPGMVRSILMGALSWVQHWRERRTVRPHDHALSFSLDETLGRSALQAQQPTPPSRTRPQSRWR